MKKWSDTVNFNYNFINVDADEEEKRENTITHISHSRNMCWMDKVVLKRKLTWFLYVLDMSKMVMRLNI